MFYYLPSQESEKAPRLKGSFPLDESSESIVCS